MTLIDLQILYYLSRNPDENTSVDILNLEQFSKSHISQSLSHLEEKKMILRRRDGKDKRVIHNLLTDKSTPLVRELETLHQTVNETVLADFSQKELDTLEQYSAKILRNLSAELKSDNIAKNQLIGKTLREE